MMKHSASFRRVLVLVYGTVVVFALLIAGIYSVVSPQIFAGNKIDDLIPKGQIIAGYIESTLLQMLHEHRLGGGNLPWYERAFVVITEHTDKRRSDRTFDPDNKEWKCVLNALKGVLFEDDNSQTVSLILDSVSDGKGFTEVAVVPYFEVQKSWMAR